MHFFKAFKENLENFKSPYVKRCEPVLGMHPYLYKVPNQGIRGLYPPKLYPLLISIRYYLILFEVVDKTKPLS